jgi:hypothetical protein
MGLLRVLLLAVLALSAYAVDESAVTVIAGKADFDAALASADLVMVEFYAPWCDPPAPPRPTTTHAFIHITPLVHPAAPTSLTTRYSVPPALSD